MGILIDKENEMNAGRSPMLKLEEGGQQGALLQHHLWTSSAAYVKEDVIAVLLAAPAAMKFLPNSNLLVAKLKSLIEVLPVSLEGLDSSITWEFDETTVGNAGEKFEAVIGSARARSTPSFTWDEKEGQAITRFWTELGRLLLIDPDTKKPGIIEVAEYRSSNGGKPIMLPEDRSFTVLFIEPNSTMTYSVNSWLLSNMMPKSGGDIKGGRKMGEKLELVPVTIEFTNLGMPGKEVTKLANAWLDSLNLADMRPLDMLPMTDALEGIGADGISADVAAASEGFASNLSSSVSSV